jgi:hypothetical protein
MPAYCEVEYPGGTGYTNCYTFCEEAKKKGYTVTDGRLQVEEVKKLNGGAHYVDDDSWITIFCKLTHY